MSINIDIFRFEGQFRLARHNDLVGMYVQLARIATLIALAHPTGLLNGTHHSLPGWGGLGWGETD